MSNAPSVGTPVEIAKMYGYPIPGSGQSTTYDGSGQKIGILDNGAGWNKQTCLDNLANLGVAGYNPDHLQEVDLGGGITQAGGGFGETQEDVDIVASLCPGAVVTVYSGGDTAAIINRAASDGNSVLSSSWGWDTEWMSKDSPTVTGIESALTAAGKAGMTVLVAAGDAGCSGSRSGDTAAPAPDGKAHVGYPATSPQVLAVGGTEMVHGVESVWNNTVGSPDSVEPASSVLHGATGGGVSTLFGAQSWQQPSPAIVNANDGSAGRIIPDVAAYAGFTDYQLTFSGQSSLRSNGGTSAATPMWAALIALVNQARHAAGKEPLGYVNERLYGLAADCFNDITVGNNRVTQSYPGYDAQPGFDACSGLGSPNATNLFPALVALP